MPFEMIAVRNDEPLLLDILQKTVRTISTSEHQDIANKWISVTFKAGVDYSVFLKVMFAVALLIALFLYHGYMQSRYVTKLKLANEEIHKKNHMLETLSTTDKLTGLYNRFKLDEILSRESLLFNRYNQTFSLILIDLDYFKKINDNFGHLEGDRILNQIANLLLSGIRKSDFIGRWGGEEFLIICSNTSLEHAVVLAEKLRVLIKTCDYGLDAVQTISLGVAQINDNQSLTDLLYQADKALYSAKNNGRDCVVSA